MFRRFALFALLLAAATASMDQVFPRTTSIKSQYNVSQQITAPMGSKIIVMNLPMDQSAQVEAQFLSWNNPYDLSPLWTNSLPLPFVNPDSPNLVQFDQTGVCREKVLLFTGFDTLYIAYEVNSMGNIGWSTPVTRATQNKQFSYQQIDGYVLGGGGILSDGTYTDVIDVYDCVNGPNPGPNPLKLADKRIVSQSLVLGKKLFFIAGMAQNAGNLQESASVEIIDTSAARSDWAVQNYMLSVPRDQVAAASIVGPVGGLVLVAGGITGNNGGTPMLYDVVDIWTENTTSWTTSQPLSKPRAGIRAISVGRIILFAGGYTDALNQQIPSDIVDYFISDGQVPWGTATLSVARSEFGIATIGDIALIAGGRDQDGLPSNALDIFDSVTELWHAATLSYPRAFPADVGNIWSLRDLAVYMIGGFEEGQDVPVIDVYDRFTLDAHIAIDAVNQTYSNVDYLAADVEAQVGLLNSVLTGVNTNFTLFVTTDYALTRSQVEFVTQLAENNQAAIMQAQSDIQTVNNTATANSAAIATVLPAAQQAVQQAQQSAQQAQQSAQQAQQSSQQAQQAAQELSGATQAIADLQTGLQQVNLSIPSTEDRITSYLEDQIALVYVDIMQTNDTANANTAAIAANAAAIVDTEVRVVQYLEPQISVIYNGLIKTNDTANSNAALVAQLRADMAALQKKVNAINENCFKTQQMLGADSSNPCYAPPKPPSDNTGVIVAAVLGTVFGVGITAIVCLFFTRRKKHQALLDEHLISLQTPLNPNGGQLNDL